MHQVTIAEAQAKPGDVILSNKSWKMVMQNCRGKVLESGDVRLEEITNPIPVRRSPAIKLAPQLEDVLSSYIPMAILSKMGNFASTWSRGRRESANTAEQWASNLRIISTIFCCLAIEGAAEGSEDGEAENDLKLYNELFRAIQKTVYSFEGTIRQL